MADRSVGMLLKQPGQIVGMRGVDGNNLIFHSDAKVKEIKERLDAAGIALSALGSPLGKIGIEDPFEKHFEEFKRAVEIAHKMETKNIRMFNFSGFAGLEREKDAIAGGETKVLSGAEAFALAHESLVKILEEM